MIKPASLWSLFKSCEDSRWLGDLCRTLGGQKGIDLDFGQHQVLCMIQQDSDWMDERIEQERERHRKAMQRYRRRMAGMEDIPECKEGQRPIRAAVPDNQNSPVLAQAAGTPSKEELDAALAPIPAPAPVEWFLKFRDTNATRLVVLGRRVTEAEVRSWYAFQQGQGGWRYQNAAGTPITIRNFTGSLRKHAERMREEKAAAERGDGQEEEWIRRGFSSIGEWKDELHLARKLLASGEITEDEYRERTGETPVASVNGEAK